MNLVGRVADLTDPRDLAACRAIQDEVRRRLDLPAWGARHEAARRGAQVLCVPGEDGAPETAFHVTGDGELFEMGASFTSDTERVAAAWRWLFDAVEVRRVRLRMDDPWLLPFALSRRSHEGLREASCLLYLREAAPLLWSETRPECVELDATLAVEELRDVALEHHAAGRLAFVEVPVQADVGLHADVPPDADLPPPAEAGRGGDGSAEPAAPWDPLVEAGFHAALRVLLLEDPSGAPLVATPG